MKGIRALMALLSLALVLVACRGDSPASAVAIQETIAFDGALSNRLTPSNAPAPIIARIHVGTRTPASAERIPANVALVIDTSGSMEGKPIADARAAAITMIDGLTDGDRLSIIAFGSRPETLVPPTELDGDRLEVKEKLKQMRAEGTTDMAGGLRAGIGAVSSHLDPRGINRVVLLGDGVPNEESSIRPLAQEARSKGISITALGLGADYNEVLMGAVAQLSGGRFRYVDDSAKVATFFKEEVLRLQGVYARSAAVELTPGPGVHIEEVIGQRTLPMGSKVRVELGDLSRDEERDLFVRFMVEPRRAGAPIELCDAVLSYDVPGSPRIERRVFLGAHSSSSEDEISKGRNGSIEEQALVAQAAAATVSAIELARAGQGAQARALLARVATELDAVADRSGSAKLRKEAAELRALMGDLPLPTPQTTAMPSPMEAAPSTAGAAPAAPVPAPRRSPEESAKKLRQAHDVAMQHLQ